VSFKRNLLRGIPILSRIVRKLEALETENHALRQLAPVLLSTNPTGQAASAELADAAGMPLPPATLRHWVAGTDDLPWFLNSGQLGAQTIVSILAKQHIELEQLESILDFGCGCGRVLRHLHSATVRLHGTDCNRAAIHWCDEKLNFAEFATNHLEPPTRYLPHSFDFIYAFSVYTHLPEALQLAWMREMRRILKPHGLLLITVHGDHYLPQMPLAQKVEYQRGELAVMCAEAVGQNQCNAFHPEAYVRNSLAKDFAVVDFIPRGALGNPEQDAYLLRA
jgi:SAM-dependent methyltransferase